MTFEELNLAPALLQAIAACGYTEPTPIQAQAIPVLLGGADLIGSAQTGTGKTAAFMLPALHRLLTSPVASRRAAGAPRVLVLAPTRELAQQVAAEVVSYARNARINTVCLYGGAPYPVQNRQLSRPVDVLVATPGRLIDHMERGRVDLSQVEVLVLDEADRMLDLGFTDDVDRITAATPATRQTVLFSATFDAAIARLAGRLLRSPQRLDVTAATSSPLSIDQRVHFADSHAHKHRLLDHLLADITVQQSIVFIATKRDAEALALRLQGQGHSAAALHGDMNQRERNRTLQDMRRGGVRTLVATDVAARGIDVAGITHVINFDLPRQAGDYVHRIGRTGRAGASGVAVSLANHAERGALRQIERFTGVRIAPSVIPGLEPRGGAERPPVRSAPRDGAPRVHAKPGDTRHAAKTWPRAENRDRFARATPRDGNTSDRRKRYA
ncbi:MAG: DEAD/DEAH box helicase [Pseudomonadota bacterium]|nr:DEAD/DEAH box helicase [Pseudomonadota bacterium]